MKNKMILMILAATLALGACARDEEENYRAASSGQTSYSAARSEQTGYSADRPVLSSDVRKVQRSLTTQGFYTGRIDGVWGGQTSQAILDYQTAHQETGMVTVETLHDFADRIDG